MIVFCPNCGTQNAGLPGARASCAACGSTFDVPGDAPRPRDEPPPPPPPPADSPKAASFSAPGAQMFGPATVPVARTPQGTNAMAIVSLVFGILCCIPALSPALAIGCGVLGLRQLDANRDAEKGRALAIVGIVLGGLSALFQLMGFLSSLTRRF
jgi:hypothetical protein